MYDRFRNWETKDYGKVLLRYIIICLGKATSRSYINRTSIHAPSALACLHIILIY